MHAAVVFGKNGCGVTSGSGCGGVHSFVAPSCRRAAPKIKLGMIYTAVTFKTYLLMLQQHAIVRYPSCIILYIYVSFVLYNYYLVM